jgi:hypothetical protein
VEVYQVQPVNMPLFAALAGQLPLQLTRLRSSFEFISEPDIAYVDAALAQLPELTNLAHLDLIGPVEGEFEVPVELEQLTHLGLHFDYWGDTPPALQHLSSLTALQQLSVSGGLTAGDLSGVQHLSQL